VVVVLRAFVCRLQQLSLTGITDVQQLTAVVLQNIGLPAASNLVLLYEDPGACMI
jgi:hypothetical protein